MERREKSSRYIILIFFIPFLIWILLQFFAPFIIPHNTVDDLSGFTGVSDNEKLKDSMAFPWNSIYGCGDRLCHQKAERSFFINDNQMPFCSRCTAIWLGLTIGLGFMVFYRVKLDEKFLIIMFIGLIPIGIDGVGQLLGFWESNNIIRLITGLLIGFVCGIAIGLIIDEIRELRKKNQKKKKNDLILC
jgi:uncharacterized membrane protein